MKMMFAAGFRNYTAAFLNCDISHKETGAERQSLVHIYCNYYQPF